jgi:hypothetical protein
VAIVPNAQNPLLHDLQVYGSGSVKAITLKPVGGGVEVYFDGALQGNGPFFPTGEISVHGGTRDKTITVDGDLGRPTNLFADAGSDTLAVIDGAGSGVFVVGESGSCTLVGDDIPMMWTIDGHNSGHLSNGVVFSGIGNLLGGMAANDFVFDSAGGLSGTINSKSGSNALDFTASPGQGIVLTREGVAGGFDGTDSNTGTLGGTFSNVGEIVGSSVPSKDALSGLKAPATWLVTPSTSSYTVNADGRVLNFVGFGSLNGGAAGSTFDVQGVGFALTVNGDVGGDVFDVSSTAGGNGPGNLSGLGGRLTINAGAGNNNRLFLDDTTDGTAHSNAVLTASTVQNLASAEIDYAVGSGGEYTDGGVNDGILIEGPVVGSTFDVQGTLQGSTTEISGGGSSDTFVVSSDAGVDTLLTGNLAAVQGTLTVVGGSGGGNRLIISDSGDPSSGNDATLTNSAITGLAPARIDYGTVGGGAFTDGATADGILLVGAARFANAFNIQSTLAGSSTTVQGNGSSDTFTIQGDGLGGDNRFLAGAGADRFTVNAGAGITGTSVGLRGGGAPPGARDTVLFNGRSTDDAATLRLASGPLGEELSGLCQIVVFDSFETVNFDGRGGNNSFTLIDDTDQSYGTALDPFSGIVYRPTGAASGDVRINGDAATGVSRTLSVTPDVVFSDVNSAFAINGDGHGSGHKDVLTVVGVSTNGIDSGAPFDETASADGSDTVMVSDSQVSIANKALGVLRSVQLGQTNGNVTFSTLLVRGGNEKSTVGDSFTAVPSNRMNILLDGMGPICGVPGDSLKVVTQGQRVLTKPTDPALGPPQVRMVQKTDGASVGFLHFESVFGTGMVAVGADQGGGPHVRLLETYDLKPRQDLAGQSVLDRLVFAAGFRGGVRVASGDVNGDGIPDLVVAAGPGGGPHVMAFDGVTGALILSFMAYDPAFSGGVNVAVGDVDCDGYADIATGAGAGGGPHVEVFSGRTGQLIRSYMAYDPAFRGGVTVACGDVDGDGGADIITGTGAGGAALVTVRDGTTLALRDSFFAFDPRFTGGVFVAAGDLDGDYKADIVVGSGNAMEPEVKVYRGTDRALMADFKVHDAFTPNSTGIIPQESGVRVAVADCNLDGRLDIVTAMGRGTRPVMRAYSLLGSLAEIADEPAFDLNFGGGVYVGGR